MLVVVVVVVFDCVAVSSVVVDLVVVVMDQNAAARWEMSPADGIVVRWHSLKRCLAHTPQNAFAYVQAHRLRR